MCVLLDDDATTAKITKALRSFLRRPASNDLVLLHLSCHGTPDPDGLDEVYLVTHDTDPADIAATALPMREVRYALEHTLKAERVVTLADTCHSAALVSGGRRLATPNAQVMKQYLQAIGESKKGRAWLMSAEANEVSLEDARWGGGHGLFTHQLIKGLKGEADPGRKGLVKVGDLFDFVYNRVIEESGHKQHPSKGVEGYDRELVLAVTAHLQLREHYELGCLLERMGWLMDDPRRFESASRQLDLAFNLAADNGVAMPEAAVRCGLARLAVADGERALSWFDKAEKSASEANLSDSTELADTRFHRPLALLDLGRPLREPLGAIDEFLAQHAGDPRTACAREMRERIARSDQPRRRALLIGIGQFRDPIIPPLKGVGNDVRELRKVLIERFAFEDVTALEDQVATRAAILEALDVLATQAGPEDVVVVYFSGHGIEGREDPYWIAYDASWTQKRNALGASEIHARLKAIPSSKTITIVDTHPNDVFIDQARRDQAYTLLFAATSGERAYEIETDVGPHGAFTWGLLHALRQVAAADLTPRSIVDIAIRELGRLGFRAAPTAAEGFEATQPEALPGSVQQQTPLLVGEADQVLFRGLLDFPALFRFSRRQHYDALTLETVERFDRWASPLKHPFPRLRQSLGRAYLELGEVDQAMRLLELAVSESPAGSEDERDSLRLDECCVHLAAGRGPEARRCLEELQARKAPPSPTGDQTPWSDVSSLVEAGRAGRRALLVGINGYLAPGVPNPRGAVADVDALANVLRERWYFTDVQVLTDVAATRSAILDGFGQLVKWSQNMPCLFAFSGTGSVDAEGRPSLIAADSRLRPDDYDDIDVEELARLSRDSGGQLIAILDAGWTNTDQLAKDDERRSQGRTALGNAHSRMKSQDLGVPEELRSLEGLDLKIGSLAIYGRSLGIASGGIYTTETGRYYEIEGDRPYPEPDTEGSKTFGLLSNALTWSLWRLDPKTATQADWISATTNLLKAAPVVVGGASDEEPVFGPPPYRGVVEVLTRIERQPIGELVPRLKRLIDAQDRPEAMLNLGLAYDALGEADDAVKALSKAMEHEDSSPGLLAEVLYHLGRVLYVSRLDLDRAISLLQDATRRDPTLVGAYYYLGRALRDSARRNFGDLSVTAFRKYLEGGAPLGRGDEVRHLIE
jgi:uncharacterized caspase-like protein